MLKAWDQILLAALLASLLALVILLLFRIRWKSLTIPPVVGLALCVRGWLNYLVFHFQYFFIKRP